MLDQNNKWRSKFDSSSLENEDWLEPSDKLFGAIEAEIYGEKKRRVVLPWLLFGVFLISIAGYFAYSFMSDAETAEQLSMTEAPRENTSTKTLLDKNPVDGAENSALENKILNNTTISKEAKTTDDLTAEDRKTKPNQKGSAGISSASQPSKSQLTKSNSNSFSIYSDTFSDLSTKRSQKSNQASSLAGQNSSSISELAAQKNSAKILRKDSRAKLKYLSPLKQTPFSLLDNNSIAIKADNDNILEALANKFSIPEESAEPNYIATNAFYFMGGISETKYKLNQNFSAAVDPADFRHEKGSGMTFSMGYKRGLSEKLGLFVELDFAKTTFTSGHNSSYAWDPSTELNESQQVDLTMATPLGFMEGSVLLLRTSELSAPERGLVLDLHNEHSYSTAGLNVGLSYKLFRISKFAIGLDAAIGVQKLFGLSNELTEVNTSNTIVGASQTNILTDQSTIREWLPRSLLGVELKRDFGINRSIGITYKYITGLQAIHSEGDLSTSISEQRLQLRLLQNF